MSASGQLFMDANEKTCEQFQDGEIDESEFRSTMKSRGFDPQEIDDHVGALLN